MTNLKDKLLDPSREIVIPNFSFGIPSEYFELSEGISEFAILELNSPNEAYDLISFYMDISIENPILKELFEKMREVIFLKGIFYESLFVEFRLLTCYEEMKKSNDRIMNGFKVDDPCILVNVPIREAIKAKYQAALKDSREVAKGFLKKADSKTFALLRDNLPLLFAKRFGHWIKLREKMLEIDESILKEYTKVYKEYMECVN